MQIVENLNEKEMGVFGTNDELLTKIQQGLAKCKSEKMAYPEYEELLQNTRELHERVVLIRLKAAELLCNNETENVSVEETSISNPAPKQTNTAEKSEISFSLFSDAVQEEPGNPKTAPKNEYEEITKSKKIEEKTLKKEENVLKNDPFIVKNEKNALVDKLSIEDEKNLASSLQNTPIHSLPSAFALNDRIRIIKTLFHGNADAFNLAIKEIDVLDNHLSAQEKLSDLANVQAWDKSHPDCILLYNYVHRRFL
jgi:hypothetical protein